MRAYEKDAFSRVLFRDRLEIMDSYRSNLVRKLTEMLREQSELCEKAGFMFRRELIECLSRAAFQRRDTEKFLTTYEKVKKEVM